MSINIDEYELKDNESNFMNTIQLALYSNMEYKQTFKPKEMYDVSMVSLRMGQFNSVDPISITDIKAGKCPPLTLKVTMTVTNLVTKQSSKYSGTPEGLVCHGILPWVNMPLEKPVHFEPGQDGEIGMYSEGGWQEINGIMKGKNTIFYVTRNPNISYQNGALYRYQYWNKSWMKMIFQNKPYLASFRLWSKKPIEILPEPEILPMALCPSCGFVFPQDNTVTPGQPTPTP